MKLFLATLILIWMSPSWAASTRTIDADFIRSSDATKTYTLPAASGTIQVTGGLYQEVPSGTVNGSNVTFSTTYAAVAANTVLLYLDGLLLTQSVDYTYSGSTITMTTAPAVGQTLVVYYARF